MIQNNKLPPIITKTLTVQELGKEGDGVVIADDQRLYIPFATPEDEVVVELALTKKNRYKILKHQITKQGKNFSPPPCPHYGVCGSCQLQHLSDETYLKFKRDKIINPLLFEGFQNPNSVVRSPIVLPPGLRRRANFNFQRLGNKVELGYHKYHSYELLTLECCHILKPEIVRFMKPLMAALEETLAPGIEGEIFITAAHNGLDVHVEIRDKTPLTLEQKELWGQFATHQNLCRLIVSTKGKEDFIILHETPYVLFDGVPVESDCRSFLQPSSEADQHLISLVCELLPPGPSKIADLFCGRGTLSLPLARYAPVEGFEMDVSALNALEAAAKKAQRPIFLHQRDLFKTPLIENELSSFDVVVIDPPRAGAETQSRILATSKVPTLIYISCNPLTFARDARILCEGGYHLEIIQPLDQFRWTVHIEVIAKFTKKL
ncbi:MAG: class I SAM-dependent RNA methyltransferase [Alphaproteobacteria bacterium]|nr:class I SAM-dependent RNA methyltransferase [Alphaproteobacteria bacterium]